MIMVCGDLNCPNLVRIYDLEKKIMRLEKEIRNLKIENQRYSDILHRNMEEVYKTLRIET